MQAARQQLWHRYGLPGFVVDVGAFLRDPMAVLSARTRHQPGRALPFCADQHRRRRSRRTPADSLEGGFADLWVVAQWPPVAGGELGARGVVLVVGLTVEN